MKREKLVTKDRKRKWEKKHRMKALGQVRKKYFVSTESLIIFYFAALYSAQVISNSFAAHTSCVRMYIMFVSHGCVCVCEWQQQQEWDEVGPRHWRSSPLAEVHVAQQEKEEGRKAVIPYTQQNTLTVSWHLPSNRPTRDLIWQCVRQCLCTCL